MDFYHITERAGKEEGVELYPNFVIKRSKDLMVRGKAFYAVWDESAGLWSMDEYDVQRLVDADLLDHKAKLEPNVDGKVKVKFMANYDSGIWTQFQNYVKSLADAYHEMDSHLTFLNSGVKKEDYVSKRLPYALESGDISAWDEIVSTLYDPEQRQKIEWIIGAIVSGDSKHIQKAGVFYGPPGSGKGTIINIIMWLFAGYYATFDAKQLTSNNNTFALEDFRNNPLVGINHDGDLSKIEDNAKLNSLISHEDMSMNEKYKASRTAAFHAFLLLGTNKPVKFTDAKSGMIRRIIDIHPSGRKLAPRTYQALMAKVQFELGAIAQHCLDVYRELGKNYYEDYVATGMMLQTNVFYNFIEDYQDEFHREGGVTLQRAFDLFNHWAEDAKIGYTVSKHKFRDELLNYFGKFEERATVDGVQVRSWYSEFLTQKFQAEVQPEHMMSLVMDQDVSLFDTEFADCIAQYSKANGAPVKYWDDSVKQKNGKDYIPKPSEIASTTLAELDTSKEHFVKVPENLIVIDFDLTDEDGNKSVEKNLEAASEWPATYAEFSKSGGGVHLHYYYTGDTSELSALYSEGIEVKVFNGNSSLRRRLSKCNNVPIQVLSSGLPLKEKKVISDSQVRSEKALRELVMRNMRKEIMPGTKPSVDFIHKILEDAYASGLVYDLTDLRSHMVRFAQGSTNQSLAALKLVKTMKFKSEVSANDNPENKPDPTVSAFGKAADKRLVIYDVEVFRNVFIVCWKYEGDASVVSMINPKRVELEGLMRMPLVGFNNRKYDNHILWAAYMGYNNQQLYELSKRIITGVPNSTFGEAYELSYADIYDFSSIKMSLKKFEVLLGLKHNEFHFDYDEDRYETQWDAPLPEELWESAVEYCCDDVIATDAVLQDRRQDLVARQILASISGLSVNATTQAHTARIVFKGDRMAHKKFRYKDLSEEFPGYTFNPKVKVGKSSYRDEDPGEGGYVYAEPGMYENVALLDIASMHPTTMHVLDVFGKEYTENFWQLVLARLAIKHKDYDSARKMLDGALAPHLGSEDDAKALSYALKIVINIVYGLTSAKFDNPFRDKNNVDNIVAKRGALFMIELKHAVQALGYTVAHIKTDSIKIPNADKEIIDFVMEFGDKYGYTFEHEATYEKMALVNNAVYVAKTLDGREPSYWTAVGKEFQHPFILKTLFTHEKIEFRDFCEVKQVTTSMYLDVKGEVAKANAEERPARKSEMDFIGKVGLFVPIIPGRGGGKLYREKEGKFSAATGTTGYEWLPADVVTTLGKEDDVDMEYFRKLVDDAKESIEKFGDVGQFLDPEGSDEPIPFHDPKELTDPEGGVE